MLAKEFAEKKIINSNVIWLDAADFDSSIESNLQLEHALSELIKFVTVNEAYLFIDGAEKLYHEKQQQTLALFIQAATSNNLPWKIIMSCPDDSVDRLLQSFYQHNITTDWINYIEIPALDDDTVLELAKQYPELGSFLMKIAGAKNFEQLETIR